MEPPLGAATRYQMGLSFECPRHREHRLWFWFDNPCDAEAPCPAARLNAELYPRLVHRIGIDLEDITLTPDRNSHQPLDVYQHWRGYVHNGEVLDAIRFGSGW